MSGFVYQGRSACPRDKLFHLACESNGRVLCSYWAASALDAEIIAMRSTGYRSLHDAATALGMAEDDSPVLFEMKAV